MSTENKAKKMANQIDGVLVKPLRQICDERGKIMHMMRSDDEHFKRFGEIYFSQIFPQVIKGWHIHTKMTLNYAVVYGAIKLVLFDDRPESPTRGVVQEVFLSEANYQLVQVPPMVWNGFKGIGTTPSILANCADLAHDPEEIKRLDPFDPSIPYDWAVKHG